MCVCVCVCVHSQFHAVIMSIQTTHKHKWLIRERIRDELTSVYPMVRTQISERPLLEASDRLSETRPYPNKEADECPDGEENACTRIHVSKHLNA